MKLWWNKFSPALKGTRHNSLIATTFFFCHFIFLFYRSRRGTRRRPSLTLPNAAMHRIFIIYEVLNEQNEKAEW